MAKAEAGHADNRRVLFLLSDLASYITGHTLPVEGGWQAAYLVERGA